MQVDNFKAKLKAKNDKKDKKAKKEKSKKHKKNEGKKKKKSSKDVLMYTEADYATVRVQPLSLSSVLTIALCCAPSLSISLSPLCSHNRIPPLL